MAQINITVDDSLAEAIDELASSKQLSRPELVRQVLREMVAGHREGRPLFQVPSAPTDLASLSELSHEVTALTVELDRVLRDHDRRVGRLERRWNAGEEAVQAAQQRLAEQLRALVNELSNPFHDQVDALRFDLFARADQLDASMAQSPALKEMSERLAELRVAVRKDRPHIINHYDIFTVGWGAKWTIWLGVFLLHTLLLVVAGKALPDSWIANPITLAMHGSTRNAICALYHQASYTKNCPVLIDPASLAQKRGRR